MRMNISCVACLLRRNLREAEKYGDENSRMAFARDLMGALLAAPADVAAPYMSPIIADLFQKHFGLSPDRFQEEKAFSNEFVLSRLEKVERLISRAEDPVLAALRYAILGNYIDFSALWGKVSYEELDQLLSDTSGIAVDPAEYARFRRELSQGKRLLYLTDNAGEIGFDRLLGQRLAETYPDLEITFCVRGGPALNDATWEDARAVGITERFRVIDNGCRMSGTDPRYAGPALREALAGADVVLSKGQGNLETLNGCGYNVYYAFLAKCERFTSRFGVEPLTVMFCNERRMAPETV